MKVWPYPFVNLEYFSDYFVLYSRYGNEMYFIARFIKQRDVWRRPTPYTRCSRNMSFEDAQRLLAILKGF